MWKSAGKRRKEFSLVKKQTNKQTISKSFLKMYYSPNNFPFSVCHTSPFPSLNRNLGEWLLNLDSPRDGNQVRHVSNTRVRRRFFSSSLMFLPEICSHSRFFFLKQKRKSEGRGTRASSEPDKVAPPPPPPPRDDVTVH